MHLHKLLDQTCCELNISATTRQLEQLWQWLLLLQKWNRAYNLTALSDAEQIIRRLVWSSVAIIPHLRGGTVLDVGSGGGIPGIPLAIFAPQYRYTLIDSNRKKVCFLEHCRMYLELENLSIHPTRAEELKISVPFDTILSRALGSLERFISATLHLGDKHTRWLTVKSRIGSEEIQNFYSAKAASQLRVSSEPIYPQKQNCDLLVVRCDRIHT